MIEPGAKGWLKHDLTHRGVTAWVLSGAIIAFYLILYFTERFEPLGQALHLGGKWGLYGALYTLAVVAGGIGMLRRYGHNRYQVIRTIVVMLVQVSFAFLIPHWLELIKRPGYYFSYFWPLKIEYFYPQTILKMPLPFALYSFLGSALLVPLLGVFFGKRWYCSWVCGCGGLANTAGEPFRHLSSKKESAWRFERVAIHVTLVVAVTTTVLVLLASAVGGASPALGRVAEHARTYYGLAVMTILSGVVGVGLYPLGGTRVWCRNFCPMAAMLGLLQKIGRFRIRVKPDMCISCGLCSKYCEMGIDVRSYAQANQDFTRASCVGCGMCAEVCPRGVLQLEARWQRAPQESAGQLLQIGLPRR